MKSAPSIAFDFSPSRGIAIAIAAITLLAMVAVLLGGFAMAVKLPIALGALLYGVCSLKRHLTPRVVRIAHGTGGWLLVDGNGAEFPATLVDSVRRGFLLVLGFRQEEGSVQRFVLTPDNCDADLRRRLLLTIAASSHSEPAKTAA
ncbi:MAG: hypothetical protein ABIR27_03320 [Dokdonella sp.]